MTKAKTDILRFVAEYVDRNGDGPSYKDIATALGVSKPTVSYHVEALIERGFLVSREGKRRSLRVTPDAYSVIGKPREAKVLDALTMIGEQLAAGAAPVVIAGMVKDVRSMLEENQ